MTDLILTTNPGLEDIVADELQARLSGSRLSDAIIKNKPFGLRGQILATFGQPFDTIWPIVQQMRSIHHIYRPLKFFELSAEDAHGESRQLEQIVQEVRALEIPEMETAQSFRVSSKRSGIHSFTSVDVEREVGAVLVDNYAKGVDLTRYDLNVRVDLFEHRCYVALQLTRKPLNQRFEYVYHPRVAMKTNVAYALLVLVGLNPLAETGCCAHFSASDGPASDAENSEPITLLDPFCGSGTILLEAAACFPHAKLYAGDRYDRPIEWTRDNLQKAGILARVQLRQADARDLAESYPAESIGYIVTNPPFGKELGPKTNFHGLYLHFLRAAHIVLKPKGRIAMLVWRRTVFTRVARKVGFRILHVRIVDTGGLFPGIFILEKVGSTDPSTISC